MVLPRAYRFEDDFAAAVARVEKALPPEVTRLGFEFREDWMGEPSVFFQVTIVDEALVHGTLGELVMEVRRIVDEEIEPQDEWGVRSYFRYRTVSEQAHLKELAWA